MEDKKIDPKLTQNFVADILAKGKRGEYRVEVMVGDKNIPIDVYPDVFPPKSDYSISSRSVFEAFGNLKGEEVADIGCGTGIESIIAIFAGAAHVDASDINPVAYKCTKHNIELNNLRNSISVYEGNLFNPLPPDKKYDLIIANLPIVDFPSTARKDIAQALYDPSFSVHKAMFVEAKKHLTEDGEVTFTHANLQSANTKDPNRDFMILDELIDNYSYKIIEKKESDALGYKWINYKIKQKK